MAKNRIRAQYKNVSVLLRRVEHVACDYDVFVIVEESIESARYRAAFNARKFFDVTDESLISWEDWLDNDKTKAHVLGYTNKGEGILYKGYNDFENQPLSRIEIYLKQQKELRALEERKTIIEDSPVIDA